MGSIVKGFDAARRWSGRSSKWTISVSVTLSASVEPAKGETDKVAPLELSSATRVGPSKSKQRGAEWEVWKTSDHSGVWTSQKPNGMTHRESYDT
jgi:hypothetical protein